MNSVLRVRHEIDNYNVAHRFGKWKNLPILQTASWKLSTEFKYGTVSIESSIATMLKEKILAIDVTVVGVSVESILLNPYEHLHFLELSNELVQCLLGICEAWIVKRRMLIVAGSRSAIPNQTALAKVLRYYNNSTQSPRASSVPQTLDFRNQRWDTSGMPATIPQELWDMRREDNRFKSFHLPDATFSAVHLVSVTDLAADGFFYLQELDRVKCAFCKGVLKDWEPGEQVREAHRRHFSTCPFVLFVDVGNVPRENRDADVKSKPVQCSDETPEGAVMVSGGWSDKVLLDAPPIEIPNLFAAAMDAWFRPDNQSQNVAYEMILQGLSVRPRLPVSMETARSACSEKALVNLSALQHRFESETPSETAKHPKFSSFHARLTSLQMVLVKQPDYLLAKAGFFGTSDSRVTCCFSCDLQMKFWTSDDDVWVEHARWSPRCPHVLVERGSDFVLAVHKLLPPVMPPMRSAQRAQHPVSSSSHSGASSSVVVASSFSEIIARTSNIDEALAMTPGVEFRVEARDIKARADLPVVRLLTQLGYSALQVRLFTELHLRVSGDDFASSELFVHYMICESRRMRELKLDPEAYFQARMAEIRRSLDQQPNARDSIDWKTCKVCMDKEVNVVLLDCGHIACCSVCAKSLKTCPMCRAFIKGTLVIRA